MSKLSAALQTELLGNKLISYFIEWCETPTPRVAGVAYLDTLYLYDEGGRNITFLSERKPDHNLYLGIRHPVCANLDPVLSDAIAKVQKAYDQTFWAIPEAFKFGQACQALAKRGRNVDCLTLYWGPGGVGLSLYSARLSAALQHFGVGAASCSVVCL